MVKHCFNPRAPCGARLRACSWIRLPQGFQSTRPMRGATLTSPVSGSTSVFQSTRPMRGATHQHIDSSLFDVFQSTRPMRGATIVLNAASRLINVSIHAPHAGRDDRERDLPMGGLVSIHAPHAGRDSALVKSIPFTKSFNPRAPCGARLLVGEAVNDIIGFNPRAPCGARHYSSCRNKIP